MVYSFHCVSSGGRDGRDALELPSGGQDRVQRSRRAALSAAFRHLPRSTASGDIAELPAGRSVNEDLWHLYPEPEHGLEKLAQPSSHAQFETAWLTYRLLSDHDAGTVLEVLERHPVSLPLYASSADDPVRIHFCVSTRDVPLSERDKTAGTL